MKFVCVCGRDLEVESQQELSGGTVIKYKVCEPCNLKTMVLLQGGEFDLYVHDQTGNLKKYDHGVMNDA